MSDRATEIKLIQMARRALQLDDETYRAMLSNLTGGKTSSTDLDAAERDRVFKHLKARGFKVIPKASDAAQSGPRAAQLRKLRAMWYGLADAGEVQRPADSAACDAAIEAWAKRQFSQAKPPLAALRFASGPQMSKLIEELKAWTARVQAPVSLR